MNSEKVSALAKVIAAEKGTEKVAAPRKYLRIDGARVVIEDEKNLLQIIRKARINIPTFCYHSDLSVYGACRLCLVDVQGRGLMASCSTAPEEDMVIRTNTSEIREMRRITVELLLANHDQNCAVCSRSDSCGLRSLSAQLGIDKVRFRPTRAKLPLDHSSLSLVRDPNKCILCGDCVRFCSEIQGIGALDFANRGESVTVCPAFGKELAKVECINCGQCAAVCPTGAITPRSEVNEVWTAIGDSTKSVVVQIAPAVRVALGEMFGFEPGEITTGRMVAALKMLGFKKVFDTSFAADLTVIEEATEFLGRLESRKRLPIFTSCCPGWVKYAEQYFPELLDNLSSCRSPQQMFGSLARETLPVEMGIESKDLVVVAIMPCTAKKFEARRPEFITDGIADVDYVLTTQELGRMIKEAGIAFREISPEAMDMPMGFKTGAGVIFGNSGGVSEAVVRFAYEKVTGEKLESLDIQEVRGEDGLREAVIDLRGARLKMAIVHGLKNAKKVASEVAAKIAAGEETWDVIEVMACPGGCIGGAGQPIAIDNDIRRKRTQGIYNADKIMQLHKAQDNPFVQSCYKETLGAPGSHRAHELLHTSYRNRKRIDDNGISLSSSQAVTPVVVSVCVGTSCFVRGAQDVLAALTRRVEEMGLYGTVNLNATFCMEKCDCGPTIVIDGFSYSGVTPETAVELLDKAVSGSSGEAGGISGAESGTGSVHNHDTFTHSCSGCGGCGSH
ncbi:MAG: ferredoxin [Candidatus Wallbacteria bacterium HGW-Wallbacteria-1]|jgi:NADH-quinone oxidoreductase subunit G|uniref:Ferredoxin n=1 Tax=Candidatus Wallbacteria bacterium HGW-Wallbacteria-1 TaxID=2013854 RepID=A0A2N1PIF8_9BACT|nr:MAG: ferredoxin [Candidatus Wallbacteria bacterium HGW-Wallbacteria-1]